MSVAIGKNIIYVTGLPRAGSTLMCQLLSQHPKIYCVGHGSPLSHCLDHLRHHLSDDPFLLSQLDADFELTYSRLLNGYRSFMNGWFAETDMEWVVDKNRNWLSMIETVHVLDPSFKMVVCVRDLTQIAGSIEYQHQKTILLDFQDHMAGLSPYARTDILFGNEGVIGRPLRAIESLQDVPNELQQHLFYVIFEHLMDKPVAVMSKLFSWLGLPGIDLDSQKLETLPHESDSYYRYKYPHITRNSICPPKPHRVSKRVAQDIRSKYAWFFKLFYPQQ